MEDEPVVFKKARLSIGDEPSRVFTQVAPVFKPRAPSELQLTSKLFMREDEEDITLHDLKKAGIKTTPFPFQRASIRFCMRNRRVLNGDDMGCGKTLQTLATMRMDPPPPKFFEDALVAKRYRGNTLVICPKIVMTQWIDQYGLHLRPLAGAHTPFLYHSMAKTGNATPAQLCAHELVVTTYDFLRTRTKNDAAIISVQWWRVVLDEAHQVKNHYTKRFEVIDALEATRRIGLSGTPLQNNIGDLFALMRFFRLEQFRGSLTTSYQAWMTNVTLKVDTTGKKNEASEYVKKLLHNLVIRRLKTSRWRGQVLVDCMPKKNQHVVNIPMRDDEFEIYQAIETSCIKMLEKYLKAGDAVAGSSAETAAFAKMHALRLCCTVPSLCIKTKGRKVFDDAVCAVCETGITKQLRLFQCGCVVCVSCDMAAEKTCVACEQSKGTGRQFAREHEDEEGESEGTDDENGKVYIRDIASSKLDALLKVIQALPTGDKVIVFSSWRMVLDAIEGSVLTNHKIRARVDGTCSNSERVREIQRFRTDPTCIILLMTVGAGSTGLDLQCANHVVFVDPNWNPSLEAQAEDRAYRIGQTKNVEITRLIQTIPQRTKQSMDAVIRGVQISKKKTADSFFPKYGDTKNNRAYLQAMFKELKTSI